MKRLIVLLKRTEVFSADVQQKLSHEWSSNVDQKDPDSLHIKEEQKELWTSQEEELLNRQEKDDHIKEEQEETDIAKLLLTVIPVKIVDDEDECQSSHLYQSQTDDNREAEHPASSSAKRMKTESDGEYCGDPEPARNSHPDNPSQPKTNGKVSDSSETEDGNPNKDDDKDNDDWQAPLSDDERRASESIVNNGVACKIKKKPLSCSECVEQCVCKFSLRRRRRAHKSWKFGCDVCGKKFSQQRMLKIHMKIHTGEKSFHCDVCGQKFTLQCNLKSHMTVHKEISFDCDVCGKTFKCQIHLKLHMMVHTGEKPFGCDICDQKFSQLGILRSHMRTHTGDKPFCCDVCGEEFRQQINGRNT